MASRTRSAPSTTTTRVRCTRAIHRISWRRGRLILHDHTTSGLALTECLDSPSRCREIRDAVRLTRAHDLPLSARVPPALRRAIAQHLQLTERGSLRWDQDDVSRSYPTITLPHRGRSWEARGRNGWFRPTHARIHKLVSRRDGDSVSIGLMSGRPFRVVPPVCVQGPVPEVIRFCGQIIRALHELRAHAPKGPRTR